MKKRTILLSVRNPADYNLLADLLQMEGHRVEKLSGADKMELVNKADAVLVDQVTGLKVWSFLKKIKESAGPFLPVLALLPLKTPAEPWLNKGFDDIIRMPIGKAEFKSRINSFLKLRAQSEQIIESSEQKYKAVFEATGTATVIVDEDTTIVLANNECEEVLGYSPDRLIGKRWTEFVHKEDLALMLSRHKARRENPDAVERKYEVRILDVHGDIKNIVLYVDMIPGTKQSVVSMLDITERKQAEAHIEHLSLVLRAIRGVNQLITREKDRDALLRRACEILVSTRGYRSAWVALRGEDGTAQTVAESGFGEGFAPIRRALEYGDWPDCCRQAQKQPDGIVVLHDTVRHCTTCSLAHTYRDTAALTGALRYGGRDYGVLVVALPVGLADDPDEQSLFSELVGDLAYALYALEVDEERKRVEKALRESEKKYRTLFERITNGFALHEIVLNDKGIPVDYIYLEANHAFGELTGVNVNEIIGKKVTEIFPGIENDPADWIGTYGKVALTGKEIRFEQHFQQLDKWYSILAFSPMQGQFATIFSDITERKKAEVELRRLNEELELRVAEHTRELEASNRMLEDFAYSVSHDLKAPLRAISGFSEIISRRYAESLNEEARHYFENIVQAAGQMEGLIVDLLKYSRLGKETMPPAAVSLSEVIGEIVSGLESAGATKEAEVAIDPNLPVVEGNPTLLKQVFLNLMDNVLKYRREGVAHRVEIRGRVEGTWAVVEVADNGIGIAPEYQDKIFNVFQRLHGQDAYPGTGIGLAIVKKAVNLMKGTVEVESEKGRGSVFRVKLKVARG